MRRINEIYEFNQINTHTKKKTKTNKKVLAVQGYWYPYFIDPFMIVNCTGYKKFVTFFNVVG